MKCPYVITRLLSSQTKNSYNEDGYHTEQEYDEQNVAIMAECQEENCGAWDKEKQKCGYVR